MQSLFGIEILDAIRQLIYPELSLHPRFNPKRSFEKLYWTHESIFYELPVCMFCNNIIFDCHAHVWQQNVCCVTCTRLAAKALLQSMVGTLKSHT